MKLFLKKYPNSRFSDGILARMNNFAKKQLGEQEFVGWEELDNPKLYYVKRKESKYLRKAATANKVDRRYPIIVGDRPEPYKSDPNLKKGVAGFEILS